MHALVCCLLVSAHALLLPSRVAHRMVLRTAPRMALSQSFGFSIPSFSLPLCVTPSFPTTTVDDPTAGMSEAEIANYVSNVGGGLCGNSDAVKTFIGLSLNISLITFGLFTIAYVAVYATKYFLEKQVEDAVRDMEGGKRGGVAAVAGTGAGTGGMDPFSLKGGVGKDTSNRTERRLKQKINKDKKQQ